MTQVKVIPISKKMRDKVKQYGEVWNLRELSNPPTTLKRNAFTVSNSVVLSEALVSTLKPVHAGGNPYEVWVVVGMDCELELLT